MTAPDAKPCALSTCGDTIIRPPRMSQHNWDQRRYCNRTCQAAANRPRKPPPPTDTKPCNHCGQVMTRRREDGPTKWAAKLYCSRDCALAARRATTPTPPAAASTAPPAPAPWRPTGWPAIPNTGRAS